MTKFHIGVDVGSTTVKVVVLDAATGETVWREYRRHHAKSRETAAEMLRRAAAAADGPVTLAFSGSAALKLTAAAALPFVQEVFATRLAVQERLGDVDAVVELGGEDAKILFLTGGMEERMNGSCAGGTGAFIDQMAALLSLSLEELDALSFRHKQIYPIASRCGVFAKSDIQPLLNQGAVKEDIAASIYQSIVSQTIAGLAQGREIKGRVCFLGGPLTFLKGLRVRFTETLGLDENHAVFPDQAEYYVAIGAALRSRGTEEHTLPGVLERLEHARRQEGEEQEALPPLFSSEEEYETFRARHAKATVPAADLESYEGGAWLGIDAGSTTTKLVLMDGNGRLLYSYYAPNNGEPLPVVRAQLIALRERCAGRVTIRGTAVTGYGEELLKNAFAADHGIVETTAHHTAARAFDPAVDFIIDIGGQDMKCFRLRRGVVDSILLNEACSSGCGSFIETFAGALGYSAAEFAKLGLFAKRPVSLGSRCTVFMNSSVKQAQNDGAGVDDISAGLSVSVVKNAVYKVIRTRNAKDLGEHIVVQGGTFLNDAILRAFELEIGHSVTRPALAGLMGAYGAALYAREHTAGADAESTLLSLEDLRAFSCESKSARCGRCQNRCRLTVSTFRGGSQEGKKYISGNRCEAPLGLPGGPAGGGGPADDAYEYKKDLLLACAPRPGKRGKVGLPLGLGMYELLPFWHTLLTELGFEVHHSGLSSRELYLTGQHTIPSDTVCYPAKLTHGHIEALLAQGIDTIFYPCLPYNFDQGMGDNHYNCPVVAFYPELLTANIPQLGKIRCLTPYLAPHAKTFPGRAAKYFREEFGIRSGETKAAVRKAYEAYAAYQEAVWSFGDQALARAADEGRETVILAGRPYHIDPEVNHGIHKLLRSLGCVVLSEDCLRPGEKVPVKVLNQWTYHSRLYAAATFAAARDRVQLVQLISFGCGLDAITSDEVKDILEREGKIYTLIKIDEINNLGAAKIRLRSLLEAVRA
ncbi:MAG: acyl-CoA dehydratase activase [Oscillospiraceae bacterium]|jgi:predicted CoA-substrate-specific enzyme activase|nr:acyl-CoA dehydratase activase [Oscillospiraceae bacterium]